MRLGPTALVLLLAVAVVAAPLSADGQQAGKVWRIGLFHVGLDHVPPSLEPLREGLKALGYEQGENLYFDWRNLPDEDAALETAKDFVRNRVDVIVTFESQSVRAAKAATSEIPIVFLHVVDPVAEGFVKSLARPAGNLTGFVTYPISTAKFVELFREIVPGLRRLLVLVDPKDPFARMQLGEVRRAAELLKLQLVEREAANQAEIERVFASIRRDTVDGVFLGGQRLPANFSSLIIRLAAERRLPVPAPYKEWVERGALFSYGTDLPSIGRAAARYVDRILKGTKPGDLPVEQPTRFELVINLKVAKALGLTVPPSILNRADKVIQ